MKTGYTHIAFVMDRSGSMQSMAEEASRSFNQFVEKQKEVEGEATFTFVDFDTEYKVIHDFVPLDEVEEYALQAGGMTALFDAIGRTIDTVGKQLNEMDESERPEKVVVAILTDGHENSSQEFKGDQIVDMIRRQEDKYNWTFVYLGANQDAFSAAQALGISGGNAATFTSGSVGACSGISTINKSITSYRSADYDMTQKDSLLSANQATPEEFV